MYAGGVNGLHLPTFGFIMRQTAPNEKFLTALFSLFCQELADAQQTALED